MTDIKTNQGALNERAMRVRVSVHQCTFRKYSAEASKEAAMAKGAEADSISSTKYTIAKEALKPIRQAADKIGDYVRDNTLPWQDDGWRILTAAHYTDFMQEIGTLTDAFRAEVDAFIPQYQQYREEAKIRLNGYFNEADYPEAWELSARFTCEIKFDNITGADDFRCNLTGGSVDTIREQITSDTERATKAAVHDLYERLFESLQSMQERLTGVDGKGKDKVFRNTLISNVEDLTRLIPALNLTGDTTLDALAKAAGAMLADVQPDQLRANNKDYDNGKRQAVTRDVDQIVSKMAGIMGPA